MYHFLSAIKATNKEINLKILTLKKAISNTKENSMGKSVSWFWLTSSDLLKDTSGSQSGDPSALANDPLTLTYSPGTE